MTMGIYCLHKKEEHGWLVKTDINGNVLWDITIGTDPDIIITEKTVLDEQGNMYVFGLLVGDLGVDFPVIGLKLNACGELLWCRLLYFDEYEFGYFTDGIILDNGDLLGLACMPDATLHDMIFLFCISPEGDYKWKKSYASKDDYPLFSTRLGSRIQFFEDIYIISGYVYSPHPNFPTITSLRPMFIGIDTLFNEQWVLEFGLVDNMKGKALTSIPINDSLFMGVGRYRFDDTTGELQDAWAMIYNQQGEQTGYAVITKDKLGNEVNESVFYEVERINDSMYIATAGLYSIEYDENTKGEIVFDTAGFVYDYEIRIGSPASTFLTKTFDNKYTIATSILYSDLTWDIYFYKVNQNLEHDTVYPGNYTYDSLCTELPIQSGIIDLTGCGIITSLVDIPWLEDYNKQIKTIKVVAFPNPVEKGEVIFSFTNTESYKNMEFKCFNIFGTKVHEEKVYQQHGEIHMDVSGWNNGMYIGVIYNNGQVLGNCKFLIK